MQDVILFIRVAVKLNPIVECFRQVFPIAGLSTAYFSRENRMADDL